METLILSSSIRAALLALALTAPALAAPHSPGWDPARTWAFVVGVLEWKDPESWSSFDPKNRRDAMLVDRLKARGVPGSQIVYLQDSKASLEAIRTALKAFLARPKAGDTLIVYYCGHGFLEAGLGYFANWDVGEKQSSWWSMREVVDLIQDTYLGQRAFLFADCCHSGRLVEEVKRRSPTRVDYFVATSSTAQVSSTGNWTFTQAVYDAFSGNPLLDANRDGRITAAELVAYAADEMTVFEAQPAAAGYSGLDPETELARCPVAPHPPRYGDRVRVFTAGDYWNGRIVDVKADKALIRWITIGYDTDENDEWHPLARCEPLVLVRWPVGKSVQVKWKRRWWPATILKVNGSQHFVHYADFGKEWDEWVPPGRIRLPRKRKN